MKAPITIIMALAMTAAAIAGDFHSGHGPIPNFSARDCGPFPSNYEQLAVDGLNNALSDHQSSFARVGRPFPGAYIKSMEQGFKPAWTISVIATVTTHSLYFHVGKNDARAGSYTGRHQFFVMVFNGRVVDVSDAGVVAADLD